jgi:CBS domain containing-hemolysin-like protein
MDLSGGRISTLGGFVTSLLGRIPREGDTASYRNLRFTVESMRGRRVGKLRVELLEAEQ